MRRGIFLIAALALLWAGCDSSDPIDNTSPGTVVLSFSFEVDGEPLGFDDSSFSYVNAAGDTYWVSTLRYYISDVVLYDSDGDRHEIDGFHYVDAEDASTLSYTLSDVPGGEYTAVTFFLGLDEEKNLPNSLPTTTENLNMAWPIPMGGDVWGYHHLKLEVNYINPVIPAEPPFNAHLGLDNYVTVRKLPFPETARVDANTMELTLSMNVNEWWKTPNTFVFADHPPMIMGMPPLQRLLADNAADAFTVKAVTLRD